jgi:dTDP-4-dehydrorhamnose 3,5-epimerase-like enzyme
MSLIKLLDLNSIRDERGQLTALEGAKDIPFGIKRVYYLTGMQESTPRGFHAHRQLEQLAVCLAGRCRVLLDDGRSREDVWLDSPSKGLCIGKMIWHEMHDFSADCVFLVLASDWYDKADYIRDYAVFLEHVRDV